MFTTHEPCIMCSYVIRNHQIKEVVFGAAVPYIGGHSSEFKVLTTQSVPKWGKGPSVSSGLMEEECRELTKEYERRKARG